MVICSFLRVIIITSSHAYLNIHTSRTLLIYTIVYVCIYCRRYSLLECNKQSPFNHSRAYSHQYFSNRSPDRCSYLYLHLYIHTRSHMITYVVNTITLYRYNTQKRIIYSLYIKPKTYINILNISIYHEYYKCIHILVQIIHMHHTHTLYNTILTFMADIVHNTSPASTRAPAATSTFSTTPGIGLASYIAV